MRMHADEVELDAGLVRRLLAAQFPECADVAPERVRSAGTDNAIFRLGDDLAVRLPRTAGAEPGISSELRWVPHLAPHLSLPVPLPVAEGRPGEGFAWRWSVQRWLPGANPVAGAFTDVARLASFIRSLRSVPGDGGPTAQRGVPLAHPGRDAATRESIAALEGEIDGTAARAEWESALAAPVWDGPPTWLHGDLTPGNLLTRGTALTGVIDFATAGVGDPAVDLLPAWNLLDGDQRDDFRDAVGADDAMWARGRGWALSVAVIALPYYRDTNPPLVASSRRVLRELLAR